MHGSIRRSLRHPPAPAFGDSTTITVAHPQARDCDMITRPPPVAKNLRTHATSLKLLVDLVR
jgi:hypothetical protein